MIAVLVVIGLGILVALMRRGRAEYREQARKLSDLNALPLSEAERRALEALADASLFRTMPVRTTGGALPDLPAGVRRLFQRFDGIEAIRAPALRIERGLVASSSIHPGLIVIGKGMEHSDVAFEVACAAGSEAVYEVHPGEALQSPYTSIYHFILDAASEMRS